MKQSPRTPGPGAYNPKQIKKKIKDEQFTSKRELGFINEAKVKGENNPLCFNSKFSQVTPRIKSPTFKNYSKPRETKIVK